MQKSYRLRANIGVDKELRLNIEQDFDFLEVLSLKLRQEEVYNRYCSDYGVIAGRVIANGGYGVPNVRVSVFIPIDEEDEGNPIISTLYPYKTLTEKNEDGYRYNLLPYEQQHLGHTPTGTFPEREDILTRSEVLEVYEKYYKYVVKTNDSGDFMIVGVPLGTHKVVMDCDLSDIGEFSLRPYDFIRMGLATENQFNGSLFKSSENLDSLPQIINSVVDVDVTPFWGENDLCNIGITRVDFDLRNQGIEILPHSVFMGSILSTNEDDYIKSNCKPKKELGELCGMVTGPGQILAIRQTKDLDENGLPVLEEYKFEDAGYVIDENGTWMVDLPMNMDYVTTNEFGEQVITTLPNEGIPTTAKYRFKIKWINEGGLTKDLQRANYLVPNIKENGWVGDTVDDRPSDEVINKSYAFSLDWDDYYDVQSAINCEDTFYKFYYNKVYTISSHIDRFKWGSGRHRSTIIKNITDRECISENNRFPTNDASKKMNVNMFIFDILLSLIMATLPALIPVIHGIALLYNAFAFIANAFLTIVNIIIYPICLVIALISKKRKASDCQLFPDEPIIPYFQDFVNLSLPMISYPDCERCSCGNERVDSNSESLDDAQQQLDLLSSGLIANVTDYGYYENIELVDCCITNEDKSLYYNFILSGYDDNTLDGYGGADLEKKWRTRFFKSPVYPTFENCDYDEDILDNAKKRLSPNVTLAQSLNLMNRKVMYAGVNRTNAIQTKLINDQLPGPESQPFTDNVFMMLCDWGATFEPATLLTFNDLNNVADPNTVLYSDNGGNQFGSDGITGTCSNWSNQNLVGVNVKYQKTDGSEGNSTVYIHNPNETMSYKFKTGTEYFQVLTAMTLSEVATLNTSSGGNILNYHIFNKRNYYSCDPDTNLSNLSSYIKPIQNFQNYQDLKLVFMVRGVDVWTPKQKIKYDLSRVFGQSTYNNTVTVEGEFYMNVPTQRNNNVDDFNSPGLGVNKINDHRFDSFTPNPHYERNGGNNNLYWFSNDNNGLSAGGTITGLFHKPYSGFVPNQSEWIPFDTFSFNKYSSIDGQVEDVIDQSYGFDIDTFSPNDNNVIDNPNENNTPYNTSNPQLRIDGCGYQYTNDVGDNAKVRGNDEVTTVSSLYLPKSLSDFDEDETPRTNMVNPQNLIFRSDRLPSSDSYEFANYEIDNGVREVCSRYVLHLNDAFQIFKVNEDGTIETTVPDQTIASVDASGAALDLFEDNERLSFVSNTFTCEGYIPLPCYSGSGEDFGVEQPCTILNSQFELLNNALNWISAIDDRVVNGCYRFVNKPLVLSIPADWYFLFEWRTRIRYMFYICQGVISQEFYNNWVNGTLYMPSFIKKTFFDDGNEFESYSYCGDPTTDVERRYQGPIYFNNKTNSFFYRSTPYGNGVYYGQKPSREYAGRNIKNIWSPTTIMDLGPRDEFTKEISLSDEFEGYIVDKLKSTSYQDISDIVIVFAISRLTNASLTEVIFSYGDGSINSMFSRPLGVFNPFDGRIDGDFAQLVSINSEFGTLKYSDTNYEDSLFFGKNETFVGILLDLIGLNSSVLGIWFDSNTIDRRKLTPGQSTIGNLPTNPTINYGFDNSQDVPYYMWYMDPDGSALNLESTLNDLIGSGEQNTLFGSQLNTWNTNMIYHSKYQEDNFDNSNTYMQPDGGYGLGHIYNKEGDGPNDDQELITKPINNPNQNNYKVGAPFYFYFGLKVGKTAVTRYIKKYIGIEEV